MGSSASRGGEGVPAAVPAAVFGYRVTGRLGRGAGSALYAVRDPATGRAYALKHVVVSKPKDARFVEQLRAEHAVGTRVAHPGLRRSVDLKLRRSWTWAVAEAALVLELFDGAPLEDRGPGDLRRTVGVFAQAAEAVEALHRAGYVHCDLKPDNILVNALGEAKVIDLGQACRTGTAKGRIQGTADYIAPEQVRCQGVSAKTDVYNFGATLYWALTGRNVPTLFTIKRGENSLLADGLVDPPARLNPRCPEPLSGLAMECTRTRADKRPEMRDVARRLGTIRYALDKAAGVHAA
ncbi:MAG: putative serine/threonine protein kinase [Phycisphaerales bacterium]|nr:putative serine/threonine protein kinase [Phycisphaerales bacterium]